MTAVKAVRVEDLRALADPAPGAYGLVFAYSNPSMVAAIDFACPCGCGRCGCLPVNGHGRPGPSWDWDGDLDAPTLRPSVQQVGGCRWHGWLTAGEWRSV